MSTEKPVNFPSCAPLRDSFGREVKSLRLSVTQRCDLRCPHCHREGQRPSATEMSAEEIERLVRIASSLGIRKVKITGGEPLLRDDILDIVDRISPLVKETSMTTNGSRLAQMALPLRNAGLVRVNVSLHSLDAGRYARLCGADVSRQVVNGILSAVDAGLTPVKVNMVVFKDENSDEIRSMMDFCSGVGATLQLIEYEADRAGSDGCHFKERYYSLKNFELMLAREAIESSTNELHRRRRFVVRADGGNLNVEVVRPMHNTEFCSNCTRLRLSSDGRLKPCLLASDGEVDVLTPIRAGASDAEIRELFTKAIGNRRPYWR